MVGIAEARYHQSEVVSPQGVTTQKAELWTHG